MRLFCLQSEDSMEHLTAEERACIMYLEETIEALEVQEDSGFSNDEPEAGLQADKTSHMRVNGMFKKNISKIYQEKNNIWTKC